MNNNCWSLSLVAILSALHIAIGCRGGKILSELKKSDEISILKLRLFPGSFHLRRKTMEMSERSNQNDDDRHMWQKRREIASIVKNEGSE